MLKYYNIDYHSISKMSLVELKNFLKSKGQWEKKELVARVTASENGVNGATKL